MSNGDDENEFENDMDHLTTVYVAAHKSVCKNHTKKKEQWMLRTAASFLPFQDATVPVAVISSIVATTKKNRRIFYLPPTVIHFALITNDIIDHR